MGAWIEINRHFTACSFRFVAPCVGAWIEIPLIPGTLPSLQVAPCVGAWIEIFDELSKILPHNVAPCVGAWIEISLAFVFHRKRSSLLAWERGLKLKTDAPFIADRLSRSLRGSVD